MKIIFPLLKSSKKLNFTDLYSEGYTDILITFPVKEEHTRLPVNLVLSNKHKEGIIKVDTPANFYISQDGKIKYVVMNGFIIETANPRTDKVNGIVIR